MTDRLERMIDRVLEWADRDDTRYTFIGIVLAIPCIIGTVLPYYFAYLEYINH